MVRSVVAKHSQQAAILLLAALASSCGHSSHPAIPGQVEPVIQTVRQASFPQLSSATITVSELHSNFDYLQARFTISSFFARQLQYVILFNPAAIERHVPPDGLRGIVAHELAHINYYESRSRMGLLSLAGLLLPSFTTRFERKADLDAIALGYGRDLQSYRTWLYRNIPNSAESEKKRDYYSPAEIDSLLQHPETMTAFLRCIPRNFAEIRRVADAPAAACPK
jgi:hypothetical protein